MTRKDYVAIAEAINHRGVTPRGGRMIRYTYRCTQGHTTSCSAPITRCPVMPEGRPCGGTLTPTGKRSK